jgi:formylglycine-generating enzyme required for sulfatase activity/serine/threonine protein kinase/flagellin-specific chaperone FliS
LRDLDKSQTFLSQDQKDAPGALGTDLDLPLTEGEVFGDHYRMIKKLGRGGFGAVYEVYDTVVKERMAVKVVVVREGKAERAREQLIHEFRLREKIDNTAHIVKAYDPRPGEYKGLPLVLLPMELAEGGSLRQWLVQNPDAQKRREMGVEFFKQACKGVAAIHSAGLLHLDIKPENILLVGGKAKITDFGIGRFGAGHSTQNPDQILRQGIGTPQYMSPEQFHVARQKDVGPASDVYSLGMVLFEILDGSLPFDGTAIELREKHLKTDPRQLKGDLEKWSRVVQHCLAKKPENRYEDLEHLISDVDRALQGVSLSVDVACRKCGHINADPAHDICEKCGVRLPDTLFHECPRCAKKLRLDAEICPGCSFHVMAHYVLEDRWARLGKLKDEDPVGALELLELVLRDGAGEHEQKALELVKDLRKKQSQISGLIADADKAVAEGELEKAVKAWRAVLKVIPRHRTAQERIANLESTLQAFAKHWDTVDDLMEQGQFEQADGHLQKCLELIPKREKARSELNRCRQRAQEYTTAMNQARECARQKLLWKAKRYAEAALEQADKSREAKALADELTRTLKKTKGLMDQALQQIPRAEFAKAQESIDSILRLQADGEGVSALQADLDRVQNTYLASMKNAQTARTDCHLDKAADAAKGALTLCPESPEAKSLLEEIGIDQERALALLKEAKSLIRAAKFAEADTLLERVEGLWSTVKGLDGARKLSAKNRVDYHEHLQRSQQAQARRVLAEAAKEAELTCEVCPQSSEAKALLKAIQDSQSRVQTLLTEAVASTKAARFEDANAQLLQVEDLWVNVRGLVETREALVRSREEFDREMRIAEQAKSEKDLEKALLAAKAAFSVCPESVAALYLVEEIGIDQEKAMALLKEAESLLPAAQFAEADALFGQVEGLWSTLDGLDAAKQLAARNRVRYQEYLQQSQEAQAGRMLDEALGEAQLACGVCPQSSEAQALVNALQDSQIRVHMLLTAAACSRKAAKFEEAHAKLLEVEQLWVDAEGLAEAREELVQSQERFDREMQTAEQAKGERDLERALEAAQVAHALCPESLKAMGLADAIRSDQATARDYLQKAKKAREATHFDEAWNEIGQAKKIWPTVPGLREAMAELRQTRRRRCACRVGWSIGAAVIVLAAYLGARFTFIDANRRHANAAVQYAQKQDYVNALREYGKCCAIPLLASLPTLPEDVAKDMEAADLRRKDQFASFLSQAESLLANGRIDQAELNAKEASELACSAKERQRVNKVLIAIADQKAKAEHDTWLAKAQAEYSLDKKIELLQKALSCKNVASTQRLLAAAVEKKRCTPKLGHILTDSIKMRLAFIPQGEFMMGSSPDEEHHHADEDPRHRVIISEGFYMGVYEVSQAQYKAVMGSNPSECKHWFKTKEMPVETVSWHDATEFCRRLSQKEGRRYRLPTEAEWEYACRAQTTTPYSTGRDLKGDRANCCRYGKVREPAIGHFAPNRFGLYDMHGDVAEWCSDWYDPDYYRNSGTSDPQGPSKGSERVVRGGHWRSTSEQCRSACREHSDPGQKGSTTGFRVVLEIQ